MQTGVFGSPSTTKSEVSFVGKGADGIHIQIRYAEETLYGYYQGEPSEIYKLKPYAEDCPVCWSKERSQRIKSNCDVCGGTGKINGFYNPIKVQISYDSNPKMSNITHDQEITTKLIQGRMTNYPMVRPGDIVVNLDNNKRYKILKVDTTKLPGLSTSDKLSGQNKVLSQILQLSEIAPTDPEYNLKRR